MNLVGLRGATTADANTRQAILSATEELLQALTAANHLTPAEIVSAYFTVTPDLDAAFPAAAAHQMGWTDVALIDAQAPRVQGDLARCIRVLIHHQTPSEQPVTHIYLHGAQALRPDSVHASHLTKGAE